MLAPRNGTKLRSLNKIRTAAQLKVRELVVDQFHFQPELPPGWELLGAEVVVRADKPEL